MNPPTATLPRSRWKAILQQRCPRCREGRIFRSSIVMNDPCPACGLVFEREPGYFFGAMYFSYALGVAILIPFYMLARWLFPDADVLLVPLIAFAPFVFLVPALYRWSRVLWIHMDRTIAPSAISDHEGFKRWKESNRPDPDGTKDDQDPPLTR